MKSRLMMVLFFAGVAFAQMTQEEAINHLKEAYRLAVEGQTIEATEALYRGLEGIKNNPYATDTVLVQVYEIMTTEEREGFSQASDRGRFLLTYWRHHDPTPATPENERFVEHIQRLDQARRYFSSPQPRGYDDRGVFWIRYGEPDQRITQASTKTIRENEGWAYHRYSPPILLNFAVKGALYCLVKDPLDFVFPGDRALIAGVREGKRHEIQRVKKIFNEYLGDRISLDRKYFELFNMVGDAESDRPLRSSFNIEEVVRIFAESMNKFDSENAEHETVISQLEHQGELLVEVAAARFLEDEQTNLEFYIGIPFDQLADSTQQATLRLSWAVLNDSISTIENKDKVIKVGLQPEIMGRGFYFTTQVRVPLSPCQGQVALSVGHVQSGKVFNKQFDCSMLDGLQTDLLLSDIQLTSDVQPIPDNLPESQKVFVKKDFLIRPYVFREIHPERKIYFYLQAYNLLLNQAGQTDIEVFWKVQAKEGLLQKLNVFGGRSYSLSSSFMQNGEDRTESVFCALDIQRLMPGPYILVITVKDNVSGQKASREIDFGVKNL